HHDRHGGRGCSDLLCAPQPNGLRSADSCVRRAAAGDASHGGQARSGAHDRVRDQRCDHRCRGAALVGESRCDHAAVRSGADHRGLHRTRPRGSWLCQGRPDRRADPRSGRGVHDDDPSLEFPWLSAGDCLRGGDRNSPRPPRRTQRIRRRDHAMIRPALRRDRLPGAWGLVDALLGPLLVVALVIAIAWLVYQDKNMTEIVLLFGINAIMVIGFQIFVGNTGLVSFGHIAFMALGAYGAAIVSIDPADKSYLLPDL